jgi:exodeoxyribonuclease VII large subunit
MKGPAFPNVHYLRRVNTTPNILKLSELSAIVAGIFRMHFSGERYWVTAEIVGLKISRGHCYLQLVEKDEMGSTPKAEFRGIIWAGTYDRIHPRFVKTTGTPLREQMQVLLQVEVQYHERFGMSLVVQDIDPAFTLGQLEMERRQTIERLRKEGLLERNKSLDLPVSLQRIAVISAEDSKGYEDFVTRLNTNVYGYTFHLTLYTSLLQGDLGCGRYPDETQSY